MELADKNLIADALTYYADAMAHGVEWLAIEKDRSAVPLANRVRRSREIAIAINQHTGRFPETEGITPDPFAAARG